MHKKEMPKRNRKERGITLMIGIMSMIFLVPMLGLGIDVGFLFAVKSKLQASVDGCALAAARALNLGQTTAAQAATAQAHAVNWFYANFPNGYFGTYNTSMSTSNVSVFDDATNAHLRHVSVTASTTVDTFFMKWFGYNSTVVGASGDATRRDVVAMIVLDRSGSMGVSCPDMVNAAKVFTGQFAAGRDYIGALSFSDNIYLHSAPTTNFQATLGYTNGSGTGTGALDNITCQGGTATPGAIAVAYNELYKMNLPGALNVLLLETDGLPNTMIMNWYDSANSKVGLAANDNACTDKNGKTMKQGGFNTAAAIPDWTNGIGHNNLGAGSLFSIPTGMVSELYGSDPSQNGGTHYFLYMMRYWSNGTPPNFNNSVYLNGTNCTFDTGDVTFPPPTWTDTMDDISWFPTTDVFGNQLSPATNAYKSPVTMNGNYVANNSWTTYHNGVLNATDNAAYQARTNWGQNANNGIGPAYVFTIGLGGNTGDAPDAILLQRMANDPNGDNYNTPAKYSACSLEPSCVQYPAQPQGAFVYSADRTKLTEAFLTISSQILRISK